MKKISSPVTTECMPNLINNGLLIFLTLISLIAEAEGINKEGVTKVVKSIKVEEGMNENRVQNV